MDSLDFPLARWGSSDCGGGGGGGGVSAPKASVHDLFSVVPSTLFLLLKLLMIDGVDGVVDAADDDDDDDDGDDVDADVVHDGDLE